jgi:hypothetical protein
MRTDQTAAMYYAQQAMEHIRRLAAMPRGSATEGERKAAEYSQTMLAAIGVEGVRIEPFIGLRSHWLFLALVFGLALVGHAAFWLLRKPAGDYPALVITVLALGMSGFLLGRKFSYRDYPLRNNLPHATSQNVMAVIPPAGDVHNKVVLVGHLDSARAVFWFASDLLVTIFAPLSFLALYGIYAAIPIYILAILTHLRIFSWLGLVLAAFHFLAWFTGVTADLGRYSPGANDNASGVGTVLALAERLKKDPLEHTEVWVALTGCEETGGDGMLALLREHGNMLREALFVDFETVGIGAGIRYIGVEGNIHRRHIPADVNELMKRVEAEFNLQPVDIPPMGALTESGILWEYGFRAVCFSSYHPGSLKLPEWHRLTDIPDHIQVSSLERMQKLAWTLLHRIDGSGN